MVPQHSEATAPDARSTKLMAEIQDKIQACMQCGTCSGSCPMWEEANFSIRKIMHFAKFGMEEKLENLYQKEFHLCRGQTVSCRLP